MLKLENIVVFNADKSFNIRVIKPLKDEELAFLKEHNIRNFKELERVIFKNRSI